LDYWIIGLLDYWIIGLLENSDFEKRFLALGISFAVKWKTHSESRKLSESEDLEC
jgi:hypothetical protein